MIPKTDLNFSLLSRRQTEILSTIRNAILLKNAANDLLDAFGDVTAVPGSDPGSTCKALNGNLAYLYQHLLECANELMSSIHIRPKETYLNCVSVPIKGKR